MFITSFWTRDALTVGLSWGRLSGLNALPRVRIGRVVLARAQWHISGTETKSICDLDRFEAFLKIKEIQRERGLPRWVLLAESDNALLVDLDNPLSVDALIHLMKRSHDATLVEMYPEKRNLLAALILKIAEERLPDGVQTRYASDTTDRGNGRSTRSTLPRFY